MLRDLQASALQVPLQFTLPWKTGRREGMSELAGMTMQDSFRLGFHKTYWGKLRLVNPFKTSGYAFFGIRSQLGGEFGPCQLGPKFDAFVD